MTSLEEQLLKALVERYRKSKKDQGTAKKIRLTQIRPDLLYNRYSRNDGDLAKIEAVDKTVEACANKGFVTFTHKPYSSEIEKISLVDAKVEEIEKYLSEACGYVPQTVKRQYMARLLQSYENRGRAAKEECRRIRDGLEKRHAITNQQQAEDLLRAADFIENNTEPLYLREASMLIFGDSKYLEKEVLGPVSSLLRDVYQEPEETNEMADEILAKFHIIKEPQTISIKGNIILILNGSELNAGAFREGLTFRADELAGLTDIRVQAKTWMTVENKTSYMRLARPETAYMYLGGFANRFQRDFIKKVFAENPSLEYRHFGDIDAGGFFIYDRLCKLTGVPFQMYRMGIEELRDSRYAACLHPLTQTDRRRLSSLEGMEPYTETVQYMLAKNIKLEQEIISLNEAAPTAVISAEGTD